MTQEQKSIILGKIVENYGKQLDNNELIKEAFGPDYEEKLTPAPPVYSSRGEYTECYMARIMHPSEFGINEWGIGFVSSFKKDMFCRVEGLPYNPGELPTHILFSEIDEHLVREFDDIKDAESFSERNGKLPIYHTREGNDPIIYKVYLPGAESPFTMDALKKDLEVPQPSKYSSKERLTKHYFGKMLMTDRTHPSGEGLSFYTLEDATLFYRTEGIMVDGEKTTIQQYMSPSFEFLDSFKKRVFLTKESAMDFCVRNPDYTYETENKDTPAERFVVWLEDKQVPEWPKDFIDENFEKDKIEITDSDQKPETKNNPTFLIKAIKNEKDDDIKIKIDSKGFNIIEMLGLIDMAKEDLLKNHREGKI